MPRERNLDFLDELQKNLVNLNFNIPDELISSTPEDSWAQSVMGSLLALQSAVRDSTSINCIHHNFYTHVQNLDNRHRGMWGEFAALLYCLCVLREPSANLVVDGIKFYTPIGNRRIDCFSTESKVAVEVKASYISGRKFYYNQVEKDEYLLEKGHVSSVVWLLLGGASQKFISRLSSAGFEIVLPNDARLKSIREVFDLITLTDATEAQVMVAIENLFITNLREALGTPFIYSHQREKGCSNSRVDSDAAKKPPHRSRS